MQPPFLHTYFPLQEVYYLANGEYATDCAQLAVDLPSGYVLNNNNELYSSQTETTITCGNSDNNGEDTSPNRVTGSFPGKLGWLAYEQGLNHISGERKKYQGKTWCWGGNDFAARICNSLCAPITGTTSNASCYFK